MEIQRIQHDPTTLDEGNNEPNSYVDGHIAYWGTKPSTTLVIQAQQNESNADKRRGTSFTTLIRGPIPSLPTNLYRLLKGQRVRPLVEPKDCDHPGDAGISPLPSLRKEPTVIQPQENKKHLPDNGYLMPNAHSKTTPEVDNDGLKSIRTTETGTSQFACKDFKQDVLNLTSDETSSQFDPSRSATNAPKIIHYPISSLGDSHFVSPQMPIPQPDIELWESRIRDPLKVTLRCMSTKTDDYEAYSVLEFFMAGRQKDRLKPMIIITCCSKTRKKELRRILNDLKWLKELGFRPIVVVDKSFGYRKGPTSTLGAHNYEVECRGSEVNLQSCGIVARLRSNDRNAPLSQPVPITIGGFIMVNGKIYGLTIAHSLFPTKKRDNEDHNDSEISDASSDHSSTGGTSDARTDDIRSNILLGNSFATVKENSVNTQSLPNMSQPVVASKLSDIVNENSDTSIPPSNGAISFTHLGRIYQYALDSSNRPENISDEMERTLCKDQDWALVKLSRALLPTNTVNTVKLPVDINPIVILEYTVNEPVTGSVWVLTGEGPIYGELNPIMTPIQLGQSSFDVQQITLERSIGMLLLINTEMLPKLIDFNCLGSSRRLWLMGLISGQALRVCNCWKNDLALGVHAPNKKSFS